jgi:RecA-family ATPase
VSIRENQAGTQKLIQPFTFKPVADLYSAPEEQVPFCVANLLPSCGLSVLAGKPKAGKSTIARQLGAAVAQGKRFLDRETEQGPVLYLALEEKESQIKAHFQALGLTESDPLYTICGSILKAEAIGKLEASLKAMPGIVLVIIDTIFRFVGVRDGNDYVQVNNALEPLMTLAREFGCHIVMVHHMKKRETEDPMDGALGSTAIAAAVDTYIALKVDASRRRTISTRQRYGTDLEETRLEWCAETKSLSLGQTVEQAQQEESEATCLRIKHNIVHYIGENPGCDQQAILNAVGGKRLTKLRALQEIDDEKLVIRTGEGVKGAPYVYTVPPLPTEPGKARVGPTLTSENLKR